MKLQYGSYKGKLVGGGVQKVQEAEGFEYTFLSYF